MLKFSEVKAHAIAAGASDADILREAELQARQVGSVPFNNMIRALNMMTRLNSREEWTRLAGAMLAKANSRKGKK